MNRIDTAIAEIDSATQRVLHANLARQVGAAKLERAIAEDAPVAFRAGVEATTEAIAEAIEKEKGTIYEVTLALE